MDFISGPSNFWEPRRVITRPQMEHTINSATRFVDLARLRYPRDSSDSYGMDRTLKTLEELLLQHWNAVATDPRDKIFAIFRLASDGDQYDITVDYGHGVAVEKLYIDIVKKIYRAFRKPLDHPSQEVQERRPPSTVVVS